VAVFEKGSLLLGRVAGVPVRLQWTALIGAWVFTGLRFDGVAWLCFFGVVLVHELGHALVVKAARCRPVKLELTGYGGLCHWRGDPSAIGRAAIAWGGVWAQLVLLAAAELYLHLAGWPRFGAGVQLAFAVTTSNAWMIAFNLVPIAPLDGAEAWTLPVLLGRALRRPAPSFGLPAPVPHDAADEAFERGEARDEVRAVASSLLDEARRS
jgi:Zn-dependent protease